MNLPDLASFNRTVIIDDSKVDGVGIRNALDEQHISSLFIHARDRSSLPLEPFPNVRLVILDLDMIPANSNRDKANFALTYLNSIVGADSFYVLAIWSTHIGSELEEEFLNRLQNNFSHLYPCVPPISLTKSTCKNRDGKYSGHKINLLIKQEFKRVANYALFTKWEATINEVMSEFLSGVLSREDQREISKKLHALAEAYAGTSHKKDIAKNALLALNDALKGSIDGSVIKQDYSSDNKKIFKRVGRLGADTVAEINSKLIINPERILGPGSIFKSSGASHTNSLIKGRMTDCTSVMIDVTPICDVAQDKHKFSYYVHGVVAPEKAVSNGYGYAYEFRNTFRYQNKNMKVIINLKSLETYPKLKWDQPKYETRKNRAGDNVEVEIPKPAMEDADNILFKLRDNVVIDFQHKIAAYNARPGHVLLS